MSWANRLASAKGDSAVEGVKVVQPQVPIKVVYSTEPSSSPASANELTRLEQAVHGDLHTSSDITLPPYSKGLLVVDANAFIKGMDNYNTLVDAYVTTPQVIAEVKDKAARELLERLPHSITVLNPTQVAINKVLACAEKTGDLGVLSRTDIRLCALALDCCKAADCLHAAIEPRPAQVCNNVKDDLTIHNSYTQNSVSTEEHKENEAKEKEQQEIHIMTDEMSDDDDDDDINDKAKNKGTDNDDDDDESEGQWITPDNIHTLENGRAVHGELFNGGVACATSDFAMQNTLLHLGVPIVGPNGMRVKELRLWLLRCTSCFTIVMDTTRQFCPACGSGDTLRRVNYVVNSNGEKMLFINFKKHLSTRGTVYNLPRPRGGKHGTNRTLVLREDQLAQVIRGTSGAKAKARQVLGSTGDSTYPDELAGFGEVAKHKKRNLAEPKAHSSYHKYNINEKKKARAKHRK